MTSSRLQTQFVRLWQHFQGQDSETTLQHIADTLFCSRRHVRTLLNSMQSHGWLSWQAEAGRGKRSTLLFHVCLLYTSPSPRDLSTSRMPSSA